jgi:hypothetical protein
MPKASTPSNVVQSPESQWYVRHGPDMIVAGPFTTQAEAFRWLDRDEGDPISPSERRSDWSFWKSANGE